MDKKRVLIVDPQAERLKHLGALLTELHFGILEATDGDQALKMIEVGDPDLIVCDKKVAGHSAAELCEYVKEFVAGRVPFVLLVAQTERDPEQARQQIGADGVVRHPVAKYELSNLCQQLMEICDLERRLSHLQEENGQLREALTQKALIDPITKFYRFDVFKQMIVLEVKRAKRYEIPLSILLMAFDNFSKVSGWLTPPQRESLYAVTRRAVSAAIRDIDIPLLFAEERVLIVMPHTGLDGAAVVADRIRSKISGIKPPPTLAELTLSVSIAVASTERSEIRSFGTLIQEAMRGLKEADIKGGDLVLVCRAKEEGEAGECIEVDGKLGPRTFFV